MSQFDDNEHSDDDLDQDLPEDESDRDFPDDEFDGEDLDDEQEENDFNDEEVIDPGSESDLDGEDEDEDGDQEISREVVVPGQIIAQSNKELQSGFMTITDPQGNIISLIVGFTQRRGRYINVIPFKGRYIPHVDHKVIGRIVDKNVVLWKLDINSPYQAILRPADTGSSSDNRRYDRGGGRPMRKRFDRGGKKDDTTKYNTGDILIAKVLRFDRMTEPALTTVGPDLGIIKGGFLTEIAVPKIPRLIGKGGSMIKMLNSLTSARVFVAQNGIVWIKGKSHNDERIILKAIKKIENEAHTTGLTDRIKEFVENELKK